MASWKTIGLALGAALALGACGGNGGGSDDDQLYLFVADMGGDKLWVFALDEDTGEIAPDPVRIVEGPSTGLDQPYEIHADRHGNLVVGNMGGDPYAGKVTVYDKGADGDVAPRRTIQTRFGGDTDVDPIQPVGLSTRRDPGDIFVAMDGWSILYEYPWEEARPGFVDLATGFFWGSWLQSASDVVFDKNRRRLLVADRSQNAVFALRDDRNSEVSRPPEETLQGPNTLLDEPVSLDIDDAGQIYVLNHGNGSVTVYAADVMGIVNPFNDGDLAPIRRVGGPSSVNQFTGATTLAVSPAGHLYVLQGNSVKVFGPGDTTPAQSFHHPGFVGPTGLDIESH